LIALIHRAMAGLWAEYGDLLRADGASKTRSIRELFLIGRAALLTAFLAAFGRAIAEVGAIIIVGRQYSRLHPHYDHHHRPREPARAISLSPWASASS